MVSIVICVICVVCSINMWSGWNGGLFSLNFLLLLSFFFFPFLFFKYMYLYNMCSVFNVQCSCSMLHYITLHTFMGICRIRRAEQKMMNGGFLWLVEGCNGHEWCATFSKHREWIFSRMAWNTGVPWIDHWSSLCHGPEDLAMIFCFWKTIQCKQYI